MRSSLAFISALCALACTPRLPAHWAEGGAGLRLAAAVWARPGTSSVSLQPDGSVTADGELELSIDAGGRVYDDDGDPYALLSVDGQLFTSDNEYAGRVGLHNASPPFSSVSWLRIEDDGTVLWFDEQGQAHRAGRWSGCTGEILRTCTLISHVMLLASTQTRRSAAYLPPPYYPYPMYSPGFAPGIMYWY